MNDESDEFGEVEVMNEFIIHRWWTKFIATSFWTIALSLKWTYVNGKFGVVAQAPASPCSGDYFEPLRTICCLSLCIHAASFVVTVHMYSSHFNEDYLFTLGCHSDCKYLSTLMLEAPGTTFHRHTSSNAYNSTWLSLNFKTFVLFPVEFYLVRSIYSALIQNPRTIRSRTSIHTSIIFWACLHILEMVHISIHINMPSWRVSSLSTSAS